MDIPVFPAPVVPTVLVHSYLRSIENRRFIHVIPSKEIKGRTLQNEPIMKLCDRRYIDKYLILVQCKLLRPPLANFRIYKVDP